MSKEIVEKKGITGYLNRPDMQQYLNDVLGKNKEKFTTNLISAYNQNKDLQKCTNTSIVSGAIIATTLNLSLNSSLGYAYLVPFKNGKASKEKGYDVFDAQFQIGWKGYWQLALRTGEYKTINVIPVYKSQFKNWNALTEEIQLSDFDNFDNDEVAGYYAFFKLNNGFTKSMFWSRDKMMNHANTYSNAFNAEKYKLLLAGKIPQADMWRYSSYWYKNFDEMSLKTMIRQLLSKYGIMSEEMITAYDNDYAVIENDNKKYIDNDNFVDNQDDSLDALLTNDTKNTDEDLKIDIVPVKSNTITQKEKLINELIDRGATVEEAGKWCYSKNDDIFNSYLNDPASIDSILEEMRGF